MGRARRGGLCARHRRAGALLAASAALLWLPAAPGRAEVRGLEVVGAVPLDARTRSTAIPRERAIEEALWEGVSRVAADLLVDSIMAETADGSNPVRSALGDDMVPYTRSFRIVDDQGERPALFTEHPDAATEYVVVVEVQVEVDRVRERLVSAGLLEGEDRLALGRIELEIRDLTRYGGYADLVALLTDSRVGAASATPVELEPGRAVLQVEAEWGAGDLLERLLAAAPGDLRITPIEVREADEAEDGWGFAAGGPARLVISVKWTPPPPDATGPGGRLPQAWRGAVPRRAAS